MRFKEEYELFLKEWGQESQERMAIEEMSELIKELCKKIRYEKVDFNEPVPKEKIDKVYKNIQEEIADVLNMVEQLEVYYGTEEIEDIRKEKIDRTMKLLREVNDERKYSVVYYYGEPTDMDSRDVLFISQKDEEEMAKLGHILDDKNIVVIVRNKQIPEIDKTFDFDVILEGRKHSLIKVH